MEMATEKQVDKLVGLFNERQLWQVWPIVDKFKELTKFEASFTIALILKMDRLTEEVHKVAQEIVSNVEKKVAEVRCVT